ncbi:MAG: hypothetical protein ACJAZ0_001333 [Halioglobus sp.]|jgi:hypothetical protein
MIISVFSAGEGCVKMALLSHLFKLFFREVELITVFAAIVASVFFIRLIQPLYAGTVISSPAAEICNSNSDDIICNSTCPTVMTVEID